MELKAAGFLIVLTAGIAGVIIAGVFFVKRTPIWSIGGLIAYSVYVLAHIFVAAILFKPWEVFL